MGEHTHSVIVSDFSPYLTIAEVTALQPVRTEGQKTYFSAHGINFRRVQVQVQSKRTGLQSRFFKDHFPDPKFLKLPTVAGQYYGGKKRLYTHRGRYGQRVGVLGAHTDSRGAARREPQPTGFS